MFGSATFGTTAYGTVGSNAFIFNATDSVVTAETLSRNITVSYSDSSTGTDTFNSLQVLQKNVSDAIAIAEVYSNTVLITLIESILAVEIYSNKIIFLFSEAMAVAENFVVAKLDAILTFIENIKINERLFMYRNGVLVRWFKLLKNNSVWQSMSESIASWGRLSKSVSTWDKEDKPSDLP